MKTKITQMIDGKEVVIALGEAQIDPIATAPVALEALKKTDVYKKIEDFKSQIGTLANQAFQAIANAKQANMTNDKIGYKKYSEDYQNSLAAIKEIEGQLLPLATELQEAYRGFIVSEAVYFQPKPGEYIISDKEAKKIEAQLQAE